MGNTGTQRGAKETKGGQTGSSEKGQPQKVERQTESTEPSKSGTKGAPQRMQEIPVQQFRGLDPLYESYIRNPTEAAGPDAEESSDLEISTEGYLAQIPFAPGSEPCTGPNDPNYRKIKQKDVTLADLQTPRRHPIIIFESPGDLKEFLIKFNRFQIQDNSIELLMKEIENVASKGGDCRLMPDGRFIMYTKEIEEMINRRQNISNKVPTAHIKLSTLCFYLLVMIVLAATIIGGLALAMNIFFPTLFKFGSSSSESLTPEQKLQESYRALELEPGASVDEIKRQYRRLAVKLHPDRNPNCVDCEAKFMVIADAYKALLDILAGGDGEHTQKREGSDPDREFVVRPVRYR